MSDERGSDVASRVTVIGREVQRIARHASRLLRTRADCIATGRGSSGPERLTCSKHPADTVEPYGLPVCRVSCHGARRGIRTEAGLATYSNGFSESQSSYPRTEVLRGHLSCDQLGISPVTLRHRHG